MPDYTIRDPTTGRTVTVRGDSSPTEAELEDIFAAAGETASTLQPPPGGAVRAALGLPPLLPPGRDPRETRVGASTPQLAALIATATRRDPRFSIPLAGLAGAGGQGIRSLLRIANDPIPEGPGLAAVKRLGGETLGIPGEMLQEGLRQATYQAGGEGLGALLRGAGNLLRGGSLRPPSLPPPPNPNAGGRLVPTKAPTTAEELAAALAEARQPPRPTSVELPPGPPQPVVRYPVVPRAAAPAPTATRTTRPPARIVRAGDARPANQPPVADVAPPAPPPMARIVLRPQPPPTVAQTPAPLAPRASPSPVGLSDDVPMWGSGGQPAADLGELRRILGADEAGAIVGETTEAVRAATGGPSRIPMVAELAEMDRNYLRRIMDPSGSVPIRTANWMGRMAGLGSLGQMVGGPPGALLGVALANPEITGKALYHAGRAPYANLFRTALLGRLALEDQE